MYKEILLDRHPYFFIHLYPATKAKFKKHFSEYDSSCYNKFGVGIDELIKLEEKTDEQLQYLELYYEYMPVIYNDCVMNNISRHLEEVTIGIKKYFKSDKCVEYHETMLSENTLDEDILNELDQMYKEFKKEMKDNKSLSTSKKYKDAW